MTATLSGGDAITRSDAGELVQLRQDETEFSTDRADETFDYPETVAGIPTTWIEKYAQASARYATFTQVDPGIWYAEVSFLPGAGIDADTEDEAAARLVESIVGWVALKLRAGLRVPVVDGLDINIVNPPGE